MCVCVCDVVWCVCMRVCDVGCVRVCVCGMWCGVCVRDVAEVGMNECM